MQLENAGMDEGMWKRHTKDGILDQKSDLESRWLELEDQKYQWPRVNSQEVLQKPVGSIKSGSQWLAKYRCA